MDINFSKEDIAFRQEVKDWLANDYPKHVKEKTDNGIALTKLDVLDEMQEIKVCIRHDNGVPVYKTFEGWLSKTEGITVFSDLPDKARLYIKFIEEFVESNASIISTGPSRNQTIIR